MSRLVRRAPRVLALAVLAVLVPLLAACGMSGTSTGGYLVGDGQVQAVHTADRGKPVDLSGTTLDGKPLDFATDRGKVVVVNTWWSGCGPCSTEMPMLQQASQDLGTSATFVGINIRDSSAANGLAFQRAHGVTYPSLYSPDGKAVLAFSSKFSPRTIPSTAVLDTEGRVAAIIRGQIPSKLTLTETVQCVSDPGGQGCKGFE
ncbi:TlpA disulfide reductase family protein [Nocardioides sp. BP30]|uniref:TlpA disulfide reductase family protein n=1 Tax=Nocardioides sp. BP30 TaxID=3036374 RepID=UPI002468A6EE|nr:TlpA disulfide reductase family protein [Nocardioides sp. BP30]WGL52924.1 TlpA disulfide reductase family protein [Nocardioides sp. BP30]